MLDTNILSYLMRGDPTVSERLTACLRTDVLVPQPVIAEIEYGLARLRNSKRKRRLRERFDVLAGELRRAVWTDEVSLAFGTIKADLDRSGTRIEDFDTAIAAHAMALDGVLVSNNLEHMQRVQGIRLEDWSTSRG